MILSHKVSMRECSKQRCGYIFLEFEHVWVPENFGGRTARRATCPKCGNNSVYNLNSRGQATTTADEEKRPTYLPGEIEPTARMGTTRKRRVFAARRRALQYYRVECAAISEDASSDVTAAWVGASADLRGECPTVPGSHADFRELQEAQEFAQKIADSRNYPMVIKKHTYDDRGHPDIIDVTPNLAKAHE